MSKPQTYLSERGFPLLYIQEPSDRPTITLENYTKWYEGIYLVQPNGQVTKVESDTILSLMDKYPDAWWHDHLYHPRLLYRLATELDAYLCERSIEVAIGRWMLESGGCDEEVEKFKFDDPSIND